MTGDEDRESRQLPALAAQALAYQLASGGGVKAQYPLILRVVRLTEEHPPIHLATVPGLVPHVLLAHARLSFTTSCANPEPEVSGVGAGTSADLPQPLILTLDALAAVPVFILGGGFLRLSDPPDDHARLKVDEIAVRLHDHRGDAEA